MRHESEFPNEPQTIAALFSHLQSPVTASVAVTTDQGCEISGPLRAIADRYPPPAKADLVTLWKRGREPVLSITADGKVHDFHLTPARLAVLLREVADMISEHTILQ